MNERIKELAEQAGYTTDMFGVGHWDMPECQKFAELIVQECAELCDNLQKWPSTEPRHCAEEIREHFGVDE